MSNQSSDDIDREGIGMLYAGGAGMMAGASISLALWPVFSLLAGVVVLWLGIGYEIHQRYTSADSSMEADHDV